MKKSLFLFLFTAVAVIQVASSSKVNHFQDEDRRKKITQGILDNLINEKYEEVRKDFNAGLKKALQVEKISEVWNNLISVNGAYKKSLSVSTAVTDGLNQVRIRCQFENDNATLEATFTEEDKVVALFIKP